MIQNNLLEELRLQNSQIIFQILIINMYYYIVQGLSLLLFKIIQQDGVQTLSLPSSRICPINPSPSQTDLGRSPTGPELHIKTDDTLRSTRVNTGPEAINTPITTTRTSPHSSWSTRQSPPSPCTDVVVDSEDVATSEVAGII